MREFILQLHFDVIYFSDVDQIWSQLRMIMGFCCGKIKPWYRIEIYGTALLNYFTRMNSLFQLADENLYDLTQVRALN